MAEQDEVQETQIAIRIALLKLDRDGLVKVGDRLKISECENKSKLQLIKLITAVTENEELEELEDSGLSTLMDIVDTINEIHATTTSDNSTSTTTSSQNDSTTTTEEAEQKVPTSLGASTVNPDLSLFRREFKISGQIGKVNQKDKLSFSSLIYQIENGVKRGYRDGDIVDAVVRAISPGLNLRSYLEGRENLTLPNLRSVLRSHFEVKPPRDLFKLLNTTTQGPSETPQDFLIRLLDLRQKTLFAAQEIGSCVKYDPTMIKETCLYTLATGLTSESLQAEIKTELKDNPNISDEQIIEKVNSIAQQEEDRREKLRNNRSGAKVHVLETEVLQPVTTNQQSKPRNKLPQEVTEIKEELASLKSLKADIDSIKEALQSRQSPERGRTRSGCYNCRKTGNDRCTHCWSCGDSTHFRFECPRRRNTRSENGEGVTSVRDVQ